MKDEECLIPKHLLKYMNENINYGFVGKNGKTYKEPGNDKWKKDWYDKCIVQDGNSLMKSHYGTCWDQVELDRKWFEVNRENNLPTHTFLIYMKDGNFYWFEHAFEPYKGIHEFDNEDNLIDYVKDKLLEYTNNATVSDRNCIECYEYTKPK